MESGVPFRKAHHFVGELVALAEKKKVSLPELDDRDAGEVCEFLNADWREVFDLNRAFSKREKPGMPGPKQVASRIRFWEGILQT